MAFLAELLAVEAAIAAVAVVATEPIRTIVKTKVQTAEEKDSNDFTR